MVFSFTRQLDIGLAMSRAPLGAAVSGTITWLFFPSFVAGVLPLFGIWWQAGTIQPLAVSTSQVDTMWTPVCSGQKMCTS